MDLDSSADDLRLKENVKAVLIREGAMGKMRAQMRECVLKVLQKTGLGDRPLYVASDRCKAVRDDMHARRGLELVQDYLAHHDLAYTASVLKGEAPVGDTPGRIDIPEASRKRLSGEGSLLVQIVEDWLSLTADGAVAAAPRDIGAAVHNTMEAPAYDANEQYSSDESSSASDGGTAGDRPASSRSASPRSPHDAHRDSDEDDLVNSGPPLPEPNISAILPDESSHSSDADASPATRISDAPAAQQPAALDPALTIAPAEEPQPQPQEPAGGASASYNDDEKIESYDSDDHKEDLGPTLGGGDYDDDGGFDEYSDDDDDDDDDDVKLTKDAGDTMDFESDDDSDAF